MVQTVTLENNTITTNKTTIFSVSFVVGGFEEVWCRLVFIGRNLYCLLNHWIAFNVYSLATKFYLNIDHTYYTVTTFVKNGTERDILLPIFLSVCLAVNILLLFLHFWLPKPILSGSQGSSLGTNSRAVFYIYSSHHAVFPVKLSVCLAMQMTRNKTKLLRFFDLFVTQFCVFWVSRKFFWGR